MIAVIFFLLALICFALSAFGISTNRINLVAAGLACFTVPFLVQAWPG